MNPHNQTPEQAQNFFQAKVAFTSGPTDVNQMLKDGEDINVIDVRTSEDFRQGHVPGAINIPEDQWQSAQGLEKDKLNVVYCYSPDCHLAARAAVEFSSQGCRVMEMEGGMEAWRKHRYDIES